MQVFGGAQTDLTNLEFIHFWISSLIAHASPPPGARSRQGQFYPRILIVGTHRDSVTSLKVCRLFVEKSYIHSNYTATHSIVLTH